MDAKNKHAKSLIVPLLVSVFITTFFFSTNTSATTYSRYCTSTACRQAADAAAEAAEKASDASAQASDAQSEIDKKSAEIDQIQAEIDANDAEIADLEKSIVSTQNKLTKQRAALAKLAVKMYHDDNQGTTAIDILASSESISDLTEKQSRQETIEEQIAKSAKKVNETKEDLEQQQESVQTKRDENAEKQESVQTKKSELEAKKAEYEADASAYAADAAEQMAIVAAEVQQRAAEAARNNSSGIRTQLNVASGNGVSGWWGVNTYPYAYLCPANNNGFYFHGSGCQCTSYAGWKAYEKWGVNIQSWGDAKNWGNSAAARGYRVDSNPAPYTIAFSTAGQYGHVMWVESVNANGTINLTEYNNTYSSVSGKAGDFGARTNVSASQYRYIHFN